ncbi:5-oxoprolinase subunit PxpB [Pseudooceanicola sp. GBMRC 2024]|uniref:5-oxoprolinase subunit PxpB n=1 Tax=Pseudooceanicola albus TaxID=2692189 RepID=A0A6L7G152_9RHOB|nr:5-oxoprolinase subunit PxpB [Pseudooceanicola albus]MXN17781.1 5-oxoprolinase subunit PxpB [Pseudooceanicola albus]
MILIEEPGFDISAMGEGAVLFHAALPLRPGGQQALWAMAEQARGWPGMAEAIPGVANLLLVFDPDRTGAAEVAERLARAWQDRPAFERDPVVHHVAVRYGGAAGYDLEEVARATGIDPEDYIARHLAGVYTVGAIGAQPGFGYLTGLDPALAVPRRDVPRLSIGIGSVIIGGAQTAVSTLTAPSGWHVIGETDMRFFDPAAARPARLQLGDQVTFHREDFA